jgi:hypothetical protein
MIAINNQGVHECNHGHRTIYEYSTSNDADVIATTSPHCQIHLVTRFVFTSFQFDYKRSYIDRSNHFLELYLEVNKWHMRCGHAFQEVFVSDVKTIHQRQEMVK